MAGKFSSVLVVLILFLCVSFGCNDTTTSFGESDGDTVNTDGDSIISDGDDTKVDGDDVKPDGDDSVADGDDDMDEEIAPITVSYPIVDSGQSNCYDANTTMDCSAKGNSFSGQDAQYLGYQPRYKNNGDGTVSDLVTGLMWQKDPGDKMTADDAVAGAASFNLANYSDWRLPSIKELCSLILFSGKDPSGYSGTDTSGLTPFIDTEFFDFEYGDTTAGERIIDSQWASSNFSVADTMEGETMFGVNFADGRIKGYGTGAMPGQSTDKLFFVVYVRDAEAYGINDFKDNSDGTVTDKATGLMWQQSDNGSGILWENALAYCEGLTLANQNDWRLPAVKELQSIVDYSRSPETTSSAAIDPLFSCTPITNEAGNEDYAFYWSSTTHSNYTTDHDGGAGAYVSFGRSLGYMNNTWMDVHGAGSQRSDPKTGDPDDYPTGNGPQGDAIRIYNYVRCVRAGGVTVDYDPDVTVDGDDPVVDGDDPVADGDMPPVDGDGITDEPVGCDEVGQGMPCCGDDTCDGPETAANCAIDCAEADGDDPVADGDEVVGPTSCTNDSDCEVAGACPDNAMLGCTCETTPEGNSCIPSCNSDDDCPPVMGQTLVCGNEGFCLPENNGPQ